MTEQLKPTLEILATCDVCMKEIPKTEAKSEEAADYVRYFCGLECYSKWAQQDIEKED